MKTQRVHVFAGRFETEDTAMAFAEERYLPEPADNATDDEYLAWEEGNGKSQLRRELGIHVDSDFVETIFGKLGVPYLAKILVDPNALPRILEAAEGTDTYVFVYDQALDGAPVAFSSTASLRYCGEHVCDLTRL